MSNFRSRVAYLERAFASAGEYLSKWQELRALLDDPYLSIDFSEIFWMEPKSKGRTLLALESFSGGGDVPSDSVLHITSLIGLYDRATRDFEPFDNRTNYEHVIGYKIDAPLEWFSE